MLLAIYFKYRSQGLPTAFFLNVAPSRMFTTELLCLIVCPICEWCLFFKIFESNLSSFALYKTSLFVILSVHFIFNILLSTMFQMHLWPSFHFFLGSMFLIHKEQHSKYRFSYVSFLFPNWGYSNGVVAFYFITKHNFIKFDVILTVHRH